MSNPLKPIDPTRTSTLRNKFAQSLRGEFYTVGTEIERWFNNPANWVDTTDPDDVLGNAATEDDQWSFQPKEKVLDKFKRWLSQLLLAKGIEVIATGFIERAYEGGVQRAEERVLPGVESIPAATRTAFRAGTFVERLAILKTKAVENIKSLKDKLLNQVVDKVAEGMIQGQSPRQIGREINKQWRHVSKVTATRIARTEVIRAHNEGQLDRMQQLGVKKIGVDVEWSATKHSDGSFEKRVCPKCRAMDGLVMPIERAHGLLPRHPNCRCAFVPVLDDKPQRKKIRAAVRASVQAGKSKSKQQDGTEQNPYREAGQGWPGAAMSDYLNPKDKSK